MALDNFVPTPSQYNPDKPLPPSITEPLKSGKLPTDGFAEILRFFWEEALKSADQSVPIYYISDLINSCIELSVAFDRLADGDEALLSENESYRLRLISYRDIVGYITYQTPGTWSFLKTSVSPEKIETTTGELSIPPSTNRAQVLFDFVVAPLLYGTGNQPVNLEGVPDAVKINRLYNTKLITPEEAVNLFVDQIKSIIGSPIISRSGAVGVGSSLFDSFKKTISSTADRIRSWWTNLKASAGQVAKEIPGILLALGLGVTTAILVKMISSKALSGD